MEGGGIRAITDQATYTLELGDDGFSILDLKQVVLVGLTHLIILSASVDSVHFLLWVERDKELTLRSRSACFVSGVSRQGKDDVALG